MIEHFQKESVFVSGRAQGRRIGGGGGAVCGGGEGTADGSVGRVGVSTRILWSSHFGRKTKTLDPRSVVAAERRTCWMGWWSWNLHSWCVGEEGLHGET